MGLWNAPVDLKSADFLVHFGSHFEQTNAMQSNMKNFKKSRIQLSYIVFIQVEAGLE